MIEATGPTLPFSAEQMFDLAADIESYPEFLTGWTSAKILHRDADVLTVTQVVGAGPLCLAFESKAVLKRPRRIEVTSNDGPFRRYALTWEVAPISPASCTVRVSVDCELRSLILQRVLNRLLPGAVAGIVSAFGARAQAVYGATPELRNTPEAHGC